MTVGDNGLRITPPCTGDCGRAILFFGCSFTYGQGVNDNETMPYRVGLGTGSKYATYNFAVHGYGTHQMLAAIENGLVASRVKEDVRYVITKPFIRSICTDWPASGAGGNMIPNMP